MVEENACERNDVAQHFNQRRVSLLSGPLRASWGALRRPHVPSVSRRSRLVMPPCLDKERAVRLSPIPLSKCEATREMANNPSSELRQLGKSTQYHPRFLGENLEDRFVAHGYAYLD
jgi:hypothetical protein